MFWKCCQTVSVYINLCIASMILTFIAVEIIPANNYDNLQTQGVCIWHHSTRASSNLNRRQNQKIMLEFGHGCTLVTCSVLWLPPSDAISYHYRCCFVCYRVPNLHRSPRIPHHHLKSLQSLRYETFQLCCWCCSIRLRRKIFSVFTP